MPITVNNRDDKVENSEMEDMISMKEVENRVMEYIISLVIGYWTMISFVNFN